MKTFISTLLLLLFFAVAYSQAPTIKKWDYRYGSGFAEQFAALIATTDGGFMLGGSGSYNSLYPGDMTTVTVGQRQADFWVVKLNSAGLKQWDKMFGGTKNDNLKDIKQTPDGGYILAGDSRSQNNGEKTQPNWDPNPNTPFPDYWIVKIDGQGNKLWDKRYGGTGQETLTCIEITREGHIILVGYSTSGADGDRTVARWDSTQFDTWIVKIDAQGNKLWDKRFGAAAGGVKANSIVLTKDAGYILAGRTERLETVANSDVSDTCCGYENDSWLLKLDSSGNKQWDERYMGSSLPNDDSEFQSVAQTSDGGYIMAGVTNNAAGVDKSQHLIGWFDGFASHDYWLMKVDSLGKKQWDIDLGGTNEESYPPTVSVLNDGYLVIGSTQSDIYLPYKTENNTAPLRSQTWMAKVDFAGNQLWDKTIFTNGTDFRQKALQTADGCYVIANDTYADIGWYKSQDNWGTDDMDEDFWIIKLCDSTAATISNISTPDVYESSIVVFPNPSIDGTWQFVVSDNLVGEEMEVVDMQGHVVWHLTIQNANSQFDFHAAQGVYLLKVNSEKGTLTKRLVRW